MLDNLQVQGPLTFELEDLKHDFVLACRVLVNERVSEGAFNVSCRIEGEKMIAIPVTSPMFVTKNNLITSKISEDPPNWKAHPAIYKESPDVNAIIHCHPPYVTAFSTLSEDFVPVHHYGAPFHNKIVRYTSPGQTKSENRARSIARQLNGNRAILQQGHGVIVVGKDLHEALILTLFLEEACWMNHKARQMGKPNYLTIKQSLKITPQILKQRSQDKAWHHYVSKLQKSSFAY